MEASVLALKQQVSLHLAQNELSAMACSDEWAHAVCSFAAALLDARGMRLRAAGGDHQPATLEPATPEPGAPEPATPEPDAPEPGAPEPGALEPAAPEPLHVADKATRSAIFQVIRRPPIGDVLESCTDSGNCVHVVRRPHAAS